MNLLWNQEPVVARAEFSPFSGVVTPQIELQDPSSQPRASTRPGGVTRPRRLNLLELGLACGAGAAELEARAGTIDAAQRQQDRARGQQDRKSGAGRPVGDGAAAPELSAERGMEAGQDQEMRAEGQRVQAIAALASEIRTTLAATKRLTGELKALETKQEALRQRLTALLGGLAG
jgi:hypothetical protein